MALGRLLQGYFRQDHQGAFPSGVVGPFTPPANSILIARCGASFDYVTGDESAMLAVADSAGLTWVDVGYAFAPSAFAICCRVWYAVVGPAPVAMTVTMSALDANTHYDFSGDVLSYTGFNALAPIRQVKDLAHDPGSGVAPPIVLDSAPLLTSDVLGYLTADTDDAGRGLAGAGFVDVLNPIAIGNNSIEARTGSASTTVDWTSVSDGNSYFYKYCFFACEVAAAASAPAGSLLFPSLVPGL